MPFLSADMMLREPMRFLRNLSRTGGEWVPWTPTLLATVSNPTMGDSVSEGMYTIVNKTCRAFAHILVGSSFSAGSGPYYFIPPVAPKVAATAYWLVGQGYIFDASLADLYVVQVQQHPPGGISGGVMALLTPSTTNISVSGTNPFTIAAGDSISVEFEYQII